MSMKKTLVLIAMLLVTINSQNCDTGSYFDGNQCTACDFRCAVCTTANFCTVCQTQAYLTIVEGGLICKLCNQIITGCALCQSQNQCSVCLEGYNLDSAICVGQESAGGQISLHNQVVCQSFQINLNGVCHPSIALCKDYSPNGICTQCQDNSLLIQGYCIPQHIASTAIAQPNQNDQNSNLICSSRQYISNGECVTIGDECLQFLSNGSCTQCRSGYLVYNGLCVQEPNPGSKIVVSYIPTNKDQSQGSNLNSEPIQPQHQASTSPSVQSPLTSSISQCQSPCATCNEDVSYCLTCVEGYTTVDEMPGKCFKQ